MTKQETLEALSEMGVQFQQYEVDEELLLHACKTNPFTVTIGEVDGKFFATTKKHDPESYVYGESKGHAAALLLYLHIKKYNFTTHALNWKYQQPWTPTN